MEYEYTGFYARFEAPSKKVSIVLTGADTLVGDDFEVFFKVDDGLTTAWVKNRFGAEIGFFDPDATRKLQLAQARNMKIRALLSFVAYTDNPDPGVYWGEMAILCYQEDDKGIFDKFASNVANKLCDGVRTDVNLGRQDIEMLMQNPNWMPKGTIFLPETSKGSAILKSKRSTSEKLIEQGRNRNKGCYVATFAIFAIIIVLIIFGLRSCGVF